MTSICHYTINVESGEPTNPPGGIQASEVALKSMSFVRGWYNINEQTFEYINGEQKGATLIRAGYYGVEDLNDMTEPKGVKISVSSVNAIAKMEIAGSSAKFSDDLMATLGFDDRGLLSTGIYHGDRAMDLEPVKALYIHLDQLNTSHTYFDNMRSDLLGIIPAGDAIYGSCITSHIPNPTFKGFTPGIISQLNIRVKDHRGRPINNNGHPIIITLEFR